MLCVVCETVCHLVNRDGNVLFGLGYVWKFELVFWI